MRTKKQFQNSKVYILVADHEICREAEFWMNDMEIDNDKQFEIQNPLEFDIKLITDN